MDFNITAIFVIGTIFYFSFRIMELIIRRKERILFIDKLSEKSLPPDAFNKLGLNIKWKNELNKSFWPLRLSLLLIGVGIGLIVGFCMDMSYSGYISGEDWVVRNKISMIYSACVFVFGGIGLLIAFIIEKKSIDKKKENKNE